VALAGCVARPTTKRDAVDFDWPGAPRSEFAAGGYRAC
jgi:hypothetical protein